MDRSRTRNRVCGIRSEDGSPVSAAEFRRHCARAARTVAKWPAWKKAAFDAWHFKMNVGTKSLLFGVHQFLWHPWTVARAWRFLHGRWPNFPEWVCIFCHDLGYWGCPNMDGDIGQRHPELGAKLAGKAMYRYARWRGHDESSAEFFRELYIKFTLFHSRFYAKRAGAPVSELFLADKLSIAFEPRWWYLLRATLSGEISEYTAHAQKHLNLPNPMPKKEWHHWYERKVFSWLANPPK